jgi:hypothetical protein
VTTTREDYPVTETPDAPPVPPIYDPKLAPYAIWSTDMDKGARQAHDDARLPPDERQTPEDIAAQGPAYLNGYNRHWTDLRDAGVIR